MIKFWEITIPQLTGKETRLAYIYLPDSYEKYPNRRYPVMYMFDGHNVFFDSHATYGKSWGMGEYLEQTQTQMIIAAVECNHHPDFGRLKEYSPYSFRDPGIGFIYGKGDIYMDWLVNEFKPYIDANYRTLPDRDHTMIAGSSMGGLMSFYAAIAYNQYFARAACLSSAFFVSEKKIRNLIQDAKLYGETNIYMDYGSDEISGNDKMMAKACKIQTEVMKRGIYVDSRIIPHGQHCEASWEQQIPIFMSSICYGMDMSYLEECREKADLAKEKYAAMTAAAEAADAPKVSIKVKAFDA